MSDFEIDANGTLVKYTGNGGDVVIPDGVTTIGYAALGRLSPYTHIILPESCTVIDWEAFGTRDYDPYVDPYLDFIEPYSIQWAGRTLESLANNQELYRYALRGLARSKLLGEAVSTTDMMQLRKMFEGNQLYYGFTRADVLILVLAMQEGWIPRKRNSLLDSYFSDTQCNILLKVVWKRFCHENQIPQCDFITDGNGMLLLYGGREEKVEMPQDIQIIGGNAFQNCYFIKHITFSEQLISIGSYAFQDCTSLETISLPDKIRKICDYTFFRCKSLRSINLPSELAGIGAWVFGCCSSLTEVILPENVSEIGVCAFECCSSLKKIEISRRVTEISSGMLSGCNELTSVVLPKDLTEIGDSAFSHCESLNNIDLPENLTHIGRNAFGWCFSLTSLVIPKEVKELKSDIFSYCTSLISIDLSKAEGVYIDNFVPEGCTSLRYIYFPDKFYGWFGKSGFENCPKLSIMSKYYGNILECKDKTILRAGFRGYAERLLLEKDGEWTDELHKFLLGDVLPSLISADIPILECALTKGWILPEHYQVVDQFIHNQSDPILLRKWEAYCSAHHLEFANGFTINKLQKSVTAYVEDERNAFIPDGIRKIENGIFEHQFIDNFFIPDSVTFVHENALSHCNNLKNIFLASRVTASVEKALKEQCLKYGLSETKVIRTKVKHMNKKKFDHYCEIYLGAEQ